MCETDDNEFKYGNTMPRPTTFIPSDRRHQAGELPDRLAYHNSAQHKQVGMVINGRWTSVDRKMVRLISALNRLGFTTRFSCQGTKEHDAYIMFEGEMAFAMLKRQFLLYEPENFPLVTNPGDILESMVFAAEITDHWAVERRGGYYEEVVIPAMKGSRWKVEFDTFGTRRRDERHTIRFPREDLKQFTAMVVRLEELISSGA